MNARHIEYAISGIAVLAFLGAVAYVVAAILAGCAPHERSTLPAYCTEEALYTARLVRCVDDAKTLEESKACRAAVDKTCGIEQTVTVKR